MHIFFGPPKVPSAYLLCRTAHPNHLDTDKRSTFALPVQRLVDCALPVLWHVTQTMSKSNCERLRLLRLSLAYPIIFRLSPRFPKRNFRCDCPTTTIAHSCTLHPKLEAENSTNEYGQNFKSLFCRCGRPYDAKKEETMIQCLACEVRSWLV